MSDEKEIEVGDIVYQNRKGWSGVPMKVLEIVEVQGPYGMAKQAVCGGGAGEWTWPIGLYSEKHEKRIERFAIANLSHTPNVARRFE